MSTYEEEVNQLRADLLRLAADKDIPYTKAQIRKMSVNRLEEVYTEYKQAELDSVNETISDILVIKFEELLKSCSMIRQDSCLAKKLQDKKVFRRDLKNIVSYITPILPFIGLIEGGLVVASEVVDSYTDGNKNDYENEDNSYDSPKGQEHNQASTDPS